MLIINNNIKDDFFIFNIFLKEIKYANLYKKMIFIRRTIKIKATKF